MTEISKKNLVIGIGKTGTSVIRYYQKNNIECFAFDSSLNPSNLKDFQVEFPEIELYLESFPFSRLSEVEHIIVSPGVSLDLELLQEAKKLQITLSSDIEIFAKYNKVPLITVTGTNGKSTVVSLLGEMAQKSNIKVKVLGNLGTPVLDYLGDNSYDFFILELSSFQLDLTFSLQAFVGALLNISADHLDRYPNYDSYVASKHQIYQNVNSAVYCLDDLQTKPSSTFSGDMVGFTLQEPIAAQWGIKQVDSKNHLFYEGELYLDVDFLKIKGTHNWANALAALSIGTLMGLSREYMIQALREFKGLAHRVHWVRELNQVNWYNDSKGTNVGATVSALIGLGHGLAGKIVLIAGGIGKGANFDELQVAVKEYTKEVVLIGKDYLDIDNSINDLVPTYHALSLKDAVIKAYEIALPGDIVLLSPACASFDMFKNFIERGNIFEELVNQLER